MIPLLDRAKRQLVEQPHRSLNYSCFGELIARVAALEAENQQLRARAAADDSEADRADLFALCDIRRRLAELEAENQQLKAVIARIKAVRSWESLARIFKGEEG